MESHSISSQKRVGSYLLLIRMHAQNGIYFVQLFLEVLLHSHLVVALEEQFLVQMLLLPHHLQLHYTQVKLFYPIIATELIGM